MNKKTRVKKERIKAYWFFYDKLISGRIDDFDMDIIEYLLGGNYSNQFYAGRVKEDYEKWKEGMLETWLLKRKD